MHLPSPMGPEPPERRLSLVDCYRFLVYDWGTKLPWSVHKNAAQHWTVAIQHLGYGLRRIIAFLTTPTNSSFNYGYSGTSIHREFIAIWLHMNDVLIKVRIYGRRGMHGGYEKDTRKLPRPV
jgi:hypothetical protein